MYFLIKNIDNYVCKKHNQHTASNAGRRGGFAGSASLGWILAQHVENRLKTLWPKGIQPLSTVPEDGPHWDGGDMGPAAGGGADAGGRAESRPWSLPPARLISFAQSPNVNASWGQTVPGATAGSSSAARGLARLCESQPTAALIIHCVLFRANRGGG